MLDTTESPKSHHKTIERDGTVGECGLGTLIYYLTTIF